MKSDSLEQGDIAALLVIQEVDQRQVTSKHRAWQVTTVSKKQNWQRKHGEVKWFGMLLMKITKLELNRTLKTPNLHTKVISGVKGSISKCTSKSKELNWNFNGKKNPKPKTHFPAKANKQHCCFLQLGSSYLRFSY